MPPSGPRDEASLYALQGQIAAAAAKQTLGEMMASLVRAADPKAWTERYPLPAVGTAAVTGFILSAQLSSKKPRSEKSSPSKETGQASGSWLGLFLSFGMGMLKDALVPLIRDAVQKRTEQK